MAKVSVENALFKVKGTFDFGYIGLYKERTSASLTGTTIDLGTL